MHQVMRIAPVVGVGIAVVVLAGCQVKKDDEAAASGFNAAAAPQVAATAAPTPAPPAIVPTVIQSQPGPKGMVASLNKVQVTGDILTVQLTMTGEDAVNSVPLDQVSLIDDATAQRIGMLKDDAGRWMASPLSGKEYLEINLFKSPTVVWMKFPAPPATSRTVSLNIPTIAPFDGVPVTR